ncbi:MAG: RICIN domain-containing protein [Halioglobus sp.]
MKRIITFSAIAFTCAAPVQAVDFNTDALKSMQKEGHAIVAESQGARAYKASNGLCLDFSGRTIVVSKCGNSKSQKWTMDGSSRLVAHNGQCVGGSSLQACGDAKGQKWTLDGSNRLANSGKKCLQPEGNPPKAGAKVVAANCSKSAQQVWK